MIATQDLWATYRLRLKRRALLWRAFRARHQLRPLNTRTNLIRPDAILGFATVRNESLRLPHFLNHHREMGVDHFLFVDNGSTDGTTDYLRQQPDVSLWFTTDGYKASRFGLDWTMWLLMRYGHRHWCLTLDADEIFIYPHHDSRSLRELTTFLDESGIPAMGALMLDMYPRGPLADQTYRPGDDPFDVLAWFDDGPFSVQRQMPKQNLWIQGGARARYFFADDPRRAPTMNKIPLVRWNRRYAYVNSTHSMLPRPLNHVHDLPDDGLISGALLHTKFLPMAIAQAAEEKQRRQHFANSALYEGYYDGLAANPDLWWEGARRFDGWQQLESLKLISRGMWR